MRPPWVLKIISDEIIHKSDGGFVALGLTNHAELIAEVDRMREGAKQIGADVSGFLVEEMASKGTELVVGGFLDPSFGPLIMVGMGGVFVEIFKDVSFRICPISRIDAEDMIDGLKCKPILEGARGIQPVERAALVDLLLKVGGKDGILLREVEKIMELDLNPVIARGSDLVAVDARIRLKGSV
jgi:acetyl-CoA synthetase (ADP-forming)